MDRFFVVKGSIMKCKAKPMVNDDLHTLTIGNKIVAKARLIPSHSGYLLGDFLVYKRYRRKGYGSALLRKLLHIAKWETILLWVQEDNLAAISLYEKHGFKKIGKDCKGIMMRYKRNGSIRPHSTL